MKTEKENKVMVVYRGIVYYITAEEFKDLQEGWISWSDMFE